MTDKEKPIAYQAYQQLAEQYAARIDTKPHNAYYERPAMLSLLPDIKGQHVLDVGTGPGAYAEELLRRGANVTGFDASDNMLKLATERLNRFVENPNGHEVPNWNLLQLDMTKPFEMFENESFNGINAALCLDYVENWKRLFREFIRVLKPGGWFLFSCGHPASDAQYFNTQKYFSVEQVEATWTGFGIKVNMPCYRRSLTEIMTPLIDAGFLLEKVREPLPTDEFRKADLRRYKQLMHRPVFLCARSRKPN